MTCPYTHRGCEKKTGSVACIKKESGCAYARYFDFLVTNSQSCKDNLLPPHQYLDMWKSRTVTVQKCSGCAHVTENGYCSVYMDPKKKWPYGDVSYTNRCPMATHIQPESTKKKKVNALKASKRAGGRR